MKVEFIISLLLLFAFFFSFIIVHYLPTFCFKIILNGNDMGSFLSPNMYILKSIESETVSPLLLSIKLPQSWIFCSSLNNSYWCVIWKHAKILAMFLLENGITGIFYFFFFLSSYLIIWIMTPNVLCSYEVYVLLVIYSLLLRRKNML